MALPPPLPADPARWQPGHIDLARGEDGVMHGQICVAGVPYWLRAWRKSDGSHQVEFECQAMTDAEFEAIQAGLSRKVGG